MSDALTASLGRLASLVDGLVASPVAQQLEQLHSACASAVAAAGPAPGAAQQKALWGAAAELWNASLGASAAAAHAAAVSEPADEGGRRAVAALRQAACELAAPLAAGNLLPPDQAHLVRFHLKAGAAWAGLGELEAAEAVLSRGSEAAAALLPTCFERRGRGPLHQEAASLAFELLLERLDVALHLGQEVLAGGLLAQARSFAADERLPPAEGTAFRMGLIRLLRSEGQRLAQASNPAAAVPLLAAAYETLSGLDLEGEEAGELGRLSAEAQATGAQVLTLLAWCSAETGEAEQALSCLHALQQMGDSSGGAGRGFALSFLSLRVLLQLGRTEEAEADLLTLVSHEDATPEACLAGLKAALAAPGGVQMARAALGPVMERFAEEPGLAVDLVQAALEQAVGNSAAGAEAGAAGQAAGQAAPTASNGASESEVLALDLVADDRLMESVREAEPTLLLQLRGLLWNHAVCLLHGGAAFEAALAFFSAAAPLLEAPGGCTAADGGNGSPEDRPQLAECCRAQALCCLGAGQPDRALPYLAAADEAEPGGLLTAMLRLSAQLAAGSEAGAAEAVAALAASEAADADALRMACCECLDRGAAGAARQALLALLERCALAASAAGKGGEVPAGGQAAAMATGFEAAVFQNLIKLHLDAPTPSDDAEASAARSSELARLFDSLLDRMRVVKPAAFFALGTDGRQGAAMLEWLALQAWNAGQQAGASGAGEMQQAAVLLAVCGELYAVLPAPGLVALHRQKMAFLMAAAAALDVAEQQRATGQPAANSLSLARSYLQQCRGAAAALEALHGIEGGLRGQQWAADPKSDVYMLLLDFKLCCLAGDPATQLDALDRCKALPAFGAEQFARVALMARGACGEAAPGGAGNGGGGGGTTGGGGGGSTLEVCRAAEAARLQRLTQHVPLDYPAVAAALRTLLELSPADPDRLHLLDEAAGLLSATPPGAYPAQELRWLVTSAWNRGAVHARFGRAAEAVRYQRWAVSALQYDAELGEQYRELMQSEMERMGTAVDGGLLQPDGVGAA